MATHKTLTELFTAIANSLRRKTNGAQPIVADDFPSIIDSLSTGGITPTGTKSITTNGTHDVTSYATANVNVPNQGITPSGTKSITTNGTHDVTQYASANVNVPIPDGYVKPKDTVNITANGTYDVTNFASASVNVPTPTGLNARVYTVTVASDVTSGTYTLMAGNDYLASIRSNPNAFVWVWHTNQPASTAMYSMWIAANFTLACTAASPKNTIVIRTTKSAHNVTTNKNGLTGNNYSGHLNMTSTGALQIRDCNTTYPVRAGTYKIIAGIAEML